jgi:hypothetical protein
MSTLTTIENRNFNLACESGKPVFTTYLALCKANDERGVVADIRKEFKALEKDWKRQAGGQLTALISSGAVTVSQVKEGVTADGRRNFTVKLAEPKVETVKAPKSLRDMSDEEIEAELARRAAKKALVS